MKKFYLVDGWLIGLLLDFKIIRINYSNIQIINQFTNTEAET